MALTDTQIKNIKPTDKLQKLRDERGLYLFVFPTGGKIWKYRYKWLNKEQTYTIGEYPLISLLEARTEREKLKSKLKDKINPNQEKKESRLKEILPTKREVTFVEIADEWLARYKTTVVHKQYTKIHGLLHNHIYPVIGKALINGGVTSDMLLLMLDQMKAKKLKTLPEIALRTIGQIYGYAIVTKRAEASPVNPQVRAELQKELPQYQVRHHPHIGIDEIPTLMQSLERVKCTPLTLIALKLVILIHPRQGELRHCKWEYLDWNSKTLTIPSELMKGKRHEKEAGILTHVIPLPEQAIKLFTQLRSLTGNNPSGHMFPSIKGSGKVMSDGTLNQALATVISSQKQDIHGFRGLASTYLNELYPEYETPIEKMLGHKGSKDEVKRAYDHSKHLALKRRLWQEWADFLESQGMKI